MKILLLAVGRTADRQLQPLITRYADRLRHYAPFEYRELPDVKTTKGITEERQKETEGREILSAIAPGDHVILLDERGDTLTSRQFAQRLDRLMTVTSANIVFVIGGPYGFSAAVYARADRRLSLSSMTMTHEMVRLFFVEQLYRAFTILRGQPYHHD